MHVEEGVEREENLTDTVLSAMRHRNGNENAQEHAITLLGVLSKKVMVCYRRMRVM